MRVCNRDGQGSHRTLACPQTDEEYDLCADCWEDFIVWLGGEPGERPESILDMLKADRDMIKVLQKELRDLKNRVHVEPEKVPWWKRLFKVE